MRAGLLAATLLAMSSIAAAGERAIQKEVVVEARAAKAWAAWATSEGIQSFFAPEAHIEPQPGGRYEVYFNPFAPPGSRGADGMRVLAVVPERMISFTWNAPPHLPEARLQHTVVIVRVQPEGEQRARVSLAHVGWGEGGQWDEAFRYFDAAWGAVLARLQKRFIEGPTDWAPRLAQLKAAASPPPE